MHRGQDDALFDPGNDHPGAPADSVPAAGVDDARGFVCATSRYLKRFDDLGHCVFSAEARILARPLSADGPLTWWALRDSF